MKRKTTFLVSFLLVLCISSMVFVSAYDSVMIVDPNAIKDFTLSIDGNEWLEGWDYRRTIPITGSAGAGTLYQVPILVSYDSDMQTDFDDIRFTDNDGSTLLAYWIESYVASGYASVWVNVTDDLGSNQDIYIYYGNSTVSTTSNGVDTFLFYEDWTDENINLTRWDLQDSNGGVTWAAGGATHGTIATISANAGTAVYRIESDLHLASPFAFRSRAHIESTVAASQRNVYGVGTAWDVVEARSFIYSDEGSETFMVSDEDGNIDDQPMVNTYHDTYTVWDITRDADTATLIADGTPIESGDMDPDDEATNAVIVYVRDSEYQVLSDWILVRKFITSEPASGAFGDEELYSEWTPIIWQEVGEAILYFNVRFDYWGFNMILVFGGLVLMIVSVCIVAVKVRDRTITQDSGMLLLFLFCVGWGLFIGGTLIG